jgi:hypothetical protein
MTETFKKLNWKDGFELVALGVPASFEPEIAALGAKVVRDAAAIAKVRFAIAFAPDKAFAEAAMRALCSKADGDATIWLAYPKKTSRRYACDYDRDTGPWELFLELGFRPVRQVSIDEDWSALRFRRIEYVR